MGAGQTKIPSKAPFGPFSPGFERGPGRKSRLVHRLAVGLSENYSQKLWYEYASLSCASAAGQYSCQNCLTRNLPTLSTRSVYCSSRTILVDALGLEWDMCVSRYEVGSLFSVHPRGRTVCPRLFPPTYLCALIERTRLCPVPARRLWSSPSRWRASRLLSSRSAAYVSARTRVECRCRACGHVRSPCPKGMPQGGTCPGCAKRAATQRHAQAHERQER